MIRVLDIQTEARFVLPKAGEGNWDAWLAQQGYLFTERISVGPADLAVYFAEANGLYALYHPAVQGLDLECLFVNIPTESDAQALIALAQQVLGYMAQMPFGGEES